ncbi:MAG: acylneuraminate cytidylyltransferase family protein [Spartobacteria bacterium]|nr:acylneuraminate cytidylyltransferase family protein [Spartobacteria bacterium]
MKYLGKTLCMIPARAGSKRVPAKNLRYLCGKPMIAYAVECAKASQCFDGVYINTDSEVLMALAESYGVKSYRRDAWLASDEAKGDDFAADFMKKMQPDTLVMISPVCPLVMPEDVSLALKAYVESDCDTLISCEQTQMQVFCQGKGVNIDETAALAPSQENPWVQTLNWAVTIWDTATFLANYKAARKGYLGTNRLLFPIDATHSVKVSHEADFLMAERMIRSMQSTQKEAPRYWTSAKDSVCSPVKSIEV